MITGEHRAFEGLQGIVGSLWPGNRPQVQDPWRLASVQDTSLAEGLAQVLSGTRPDREGAGLDLVESLTGQHRYDVMPSLLKPLAYSQAEAALVPKDQPRALIIFRCFGFRFSHAPAGPVHIERLNGGGLEIPFFEPIAPPFERVGGKPHAAARLIAVIVPPADRCAGAPDRA